MRLKLDVAGRGVAESTQFASFSVSVCEGSKDGGGYSRREPSIMSNVSLVGARARNRLSQMRTSIARRAYGGRSREKPPPVRTWIERFNERESAALAKSGGEKEKRRGLDRLVHFVCGHRLSLIHI